MTTEKKQEFTLRITQANKTQLITILYEMVLAYIDDAKAALSDDNKAEYKASIRKIRGCMNELTSSLHLEYELAQSLLQLYLYINRELVKASLHYEISNLNNVVNVIEPLRKAYEQIEGEDASGPVMENSATVFLGLTYGRNNLIQSISEPVKHGFLV